MGKNLVAIATESKIALKIYFFLSNNKIAKSMAAIAQMSQFLFREYKTAGANAK
jgi:hypothetical protein